MSDGATRDAERPATPTSAGALRPRAGSGRGVRLTRLVTVLVVATCTTAIAAVVTAAVTVVGYAESRALRAELDKSLARVTAPLPALATARDDGPAVPDHLLKPRPDDAAFDEAAFAAAEPVRVTISRGELDFALANLDALAKQARIVPAFENGRTVGFKVFSIERGSFFDRLGLQNTDVLRRVDGHDLTSPDKALEVYAALQDARALRVDLSRRGKPMRIEYRIE